jgi:hypothetical protein
MGKNMVSKVPNDIATLFNIPEPTKFTFHSFRRTSATRAADAGATTEQLVDFFGWKNGSMCKEYISFSRPVILGMANRLAGPENTVRELTSLPQDEDLYAQLVGDPELNMKAGISMTFTSNSPDQLSVVETSIKQAVSALPDAKGANINLKVVVVNNMFENMNL